MQIDGDSCVCFCHIVLTAWGTINVRHPLSLYIYINANWLANISCLKALPYAFSLVNQTSFMLCVCIAASDFESSLDLSATSDFACYLQPQNITFPSNEKPSVGIQPRGIKRRCFQIGCSFRTVVCFLAAGATASSITHRLLGCPLAEGSHFRGQLLQ